MKQIPSSPLSKSAILARLAEMRIKDMNSRAGRNWGGYYGPGVEVEELGKTVYADHLGINALYPNQFPSVVQLENDLVAMAAAHLNGDEHTVGSFTSGGTESIMLACKAARDGAAKSKPQIRDPEMVMPTTAHSAHHKAGHYLGIKVVSVPVDPITFRADPAAMEAAITDNTILLVGSAISYAHGVVDPIPELGRLALEHDLYLHVDACMGGFLLPYYRRLGAEHPDFDLSVPGVSTVSMDLHKYGFCPKGASIILYRNKELRKNAIFTCSGWPGYLMINTTVQSTKSGGPLAAAWAVLHAIGDEGYLRMTRDMKAANERIMDAVRSIDGLRILGEPDMTMFAFASDEVDVFEIDDELRARGWYIQPQLGFDNSPPNLHVQVNTANVPVVDQFLVDLQEAVEVCRDKPRFDPMAVLQKAMGGGGGLDALLAEIGMDGYEIPDRMTPINHLLNALPNEMSDEFLTDFINELYVGRE